MPKTSAQKQLDNKKRGVMVPVTPSVLLWAREKAGFTLEEAAKRAQIAPIKSSKTSGERLEEWEKGITAPTVSQLEKIAKAYRRPLVTFLLPRPPKESVMLADFRTIGDRVMENASPDFSALKRRVEAIFNTLKEIEEQEEKGALSFVGSFSVKSDKNAIINDMRHCLSFSFDNQIQCTDTVALFKNLRQKLHNIGIYVLRMGDLGSHHSKIDPAEFRGISIADPVAPIIVVNSNDADVAQTFTLVHEMAHIWLGESGVSNVGFEEVHIQTISHGELERFCNMLAVEFLVPHNRLLEFLRSHLPNGQDNKKQIDTVSEYFKVSRPLIARKFLEIGRISEQDYWSLFQQFKAQWQARKDSQKQKESGHISRNILDKNHLGARLIHRFLTAAYDGALSYQEVSRLINVPVYRFKELES